MPQRQAKVLTVGPDINGPGGLSALMRVYKSVLGCFEYVHYSSRRGRAAGLIAEAKALAQLPFYRLGGYNVLHVHANTGNYFLRAERILRWGRRLGYRTVLHCHSEDFPEFLSTVSRRCIDTIRNVSAVAVLTERWAPFFRDELKCRRVETVPNLITELRQPRNRTKRRPEEPLRLLYMGKITADKGIFDLIRSLVPLAGKYQDYLQLTITGKGDSAALISLIDRLNLDRTVRFEGYVEKTEKDRILRLNDILVIPSYKEGMPIGMFEAGVYNMPCIATSVGAIPDVIKHGVNGYLVEPGKPEQLTQAIQYYLNNVQEIPVQARAAREMVEPYLAPVVCRRLAALHASLLSQPE